MATWTRAVLIKELVAAGRASAEQFFAQGLAENAEQAWDWEVESGEWTEELVEFGAEWMRKTFADAYSARFQGLKLHDTDGKVN